MLATNMVSFVRLFAESLAGGMWRGDIYINQYQTPREDDRFGVVDKVLACGMEGTQIESFLPTITFRHVSSNSRSRVRTIEEGVSPVNQTPPHQRSHRPIGGCPPPPFSSQPVR
ncbi:hypothetical protein TNCV_3290511 [Trichonephila clavipes]|nr:hypothetical protein TNCV_3290511 [Trichonephila clavipes]